MNRITSLATALVMMAVTLLGGGFLASQDVTTAQAAVPSTTTLKMFQVQGQGGQQLNSTNTKTVMCQQKALGFNAVALNFTLAQDTRTSTTIHNRSTIHGRSGTPTNDQLRQAIRNSIACGLEPWLKPHEEVEAGGWRGRIGTKGKGTTDVYNAWPSDAANAAWHKAWRDKLTYYGWLLKTTAGSKAGGIYIEVEQWGTSLNDWYDSKNKTTHTLNKNNGARMAATAKAVKQVVGPNIIVAAAPHLSYEARRLPTVYCRSPYLDQIHPTWYPKQQSPTDSSVARLQRDMTLDKAKYWDVVAKRCGKPMALGETGFLKLKYASRHLQYGDAKWTDADPGLQNRQYQALLPLTRKWGMGVSLYRVINDPKAGNRTVQEAIGFSWQGVPAATTISNELKKKS